MTQNAKTWKGRKKREKEREKKKKKKWRCKLSDPAAQDQAALDPGRHATCVLSLQPFFFFFPSDEHIFSGIVVAVVVVVFFFVLFLDVNRVLDTRFLCTCHVEKVPY